ADEVRGKPGERVSRPIQGRGWRAEDHRAGRQDGDADARRRGRERAGGSALKRQQIGDQGRVSVLHGHYDAGLTAVPPLNLDGVIDFTKYTLAVAAACFVYTLQTLVPKQQPAMRYV